MAYSLSAGAAALGVLAVFGPQPVSIRVAPAIAMAALIITLIPCPLTPTADALPWVLQNTRIVIIPRDWRRVRVDRFPTPNGWANARIGRLRIRRRRSGEPCGAVV